MKRYRYGLFFLTVILGAFALYRCFAERRPDHKEPESVRIGITLYRDDDTFINSICRILETEAKSMRKRKEYDDPGCNGCQGGSEYPE